MIPMLCAAEQVRQCWRTCWRSGGLAPTLGDKRTAQRNPSRFNLHARGLAMTFFLTPVPALSVPALVVATMLGAAPVKPVAQFEGKDTLLRPEGYREWVFVGSSLGLRYEEGKKQPEQLEYKNVYIDPAAYRAYKETGAFPQGTVLILETAAGEEKKEP